MINNVVIFGTIPPPIGGVTKSIENLLNALIVKNITVEIFSKRSLFKRYDIAHIHYSKSWKRFAGLIIGKLLAKKVIFTLHGNKYNNDFFNRINSKISDGVIFLNATVYEKYSNKFKSSIILTSLFKEGIKSCSNNSNMLEKNPEKDYLLIYAYDKVYQDGKDIYGVDFILNHIDRLEEKYVIVLLDPKKGYESDIENISKEKLLYIGHEIDFLSLLNEVDIYIRPTSTDGNSVAVQEALMFGKKVVASNVVERAKEVITYKYEDFDDFENKLSDNVDNANTYEPDSIEKYLDYIGKL
jgi:glycosyltransferase involved in cell wall biosynthesis